MTGAEQSFDRGTPRSGWWRTWRGGRTRNQRVRVLCAREIRGGRDETRRRQGWSTLDDGRARVGNRDENPLRLRRGNFVILRRALAVRALVPRVRDTVSGVRGSTLQHVDVRIFVPVRMQQRDAAAEQRPEQEGGDEERGEDHPRAHALASARRVRRVAVVRVAMDAHERAEPYHPAFVRRKLESPAAAPSHGRRGVRWTAPQTLLALAAAWALALGAFVDLGRASVASTACIAVAFALSLVAWRRPALALCAPAGVLAWLVASFVNRPAEASAVFALGLLAAFVLASRIWVAAWWPTGRGGAFVRRALLALGVLLAACAGAEWIARRVFPRVPNGIAASPGSRAPLPYRPDAELRHVHAPHFDGFYAHPEYDRPRFRTNGDGFRGAEWPAEFAENETRVLVLGDSTTVGFGLEEDAALPARLAVELAGGAQPVRVFNAGVAAYGPSHEERLLARLAPRLRPAIVVVIVYDGNDADDCATYASQPSIAPFALEPVRSLLDRHYWQRYSVLYHRLETALPFARVDPEHSFGDLLLQTRVEPSAAVRDAVTRLEHALAAIDAQCRAIGARCLVVRLPARVQTEPAAFAELLARRGERAEDHARELPGRTWLAACANAGIATFDLLPAFEERSAARNPRYFLEGHPNARGASEAAALIARALRERGFCD